MTSGGKWFEPIDAASMPKNFDAVEAEARWRKAWESSGIFKWDSTQPRDRTFVVDTPPPTVSGSLHMGHVFMYTQTDILVRYQRMRGRNIFYPMGWDDNGLPTERRVQNVFNVRCDPKLPYEPDLKLAPGTGKRAEPPRIVSRRNFIELCGQVTAEDEIAFRELFQRLGLSVDWREEYTTIGQQARAIAQRSFLDLWQKGHIYQVESPTMWDVDFQTAVAQAEVEDRMVQGAYHDLEFAVEGGGNFVISTTRPELLAACAGVAANPNDPRFQPYFGKHAVTPLYFARVPIFPSAQVDPEKGTGIEMVCTFGDQNDVQLWRQNQLQLRQILGLDGRVMPRTFGAPGWESADPPRANRNLAAVVGKTPAQARRIVVEQLADPPNSTTGRGAPLKSEPRDVTHSVRFYERGERPLEYLTTRQWFVRLLDKKDDLIDMGLRIRWRPEFMRKRYINWTENLAVDWCISRQRYFGVPFPVWYPLDGEGQRIYEHPIIAPAAALPIDPMSAAPPGLDESLRDRPNGFTGEPDVFDTWFTSSLTPQIGARDGERDDRMDRLFPMDIRPQAHEIIRTWAFYTIVKAMLHEDNVPWHNIVISGWVLDPERKKMSKSKGNVVTPVHLLDQFGADSVRYWSGSARLGADTAYDEQVFKVGRRLVTKIYNAGKYVLQQSAPVGAVSRELDLAFLSDLRKVVDQATAAFDDFDYTQALEATEKFFWESFADNYIELVKVRARSESDPEGRASAVATLRLGLSVLLRLFAPFVPTITEEVWSWAYADPTGKSIHVSQWPGKGDFSGVPAAKNDAVFRIACDAVAAVRKAKTEAGISLGKALTRLELLCPPSATLLIATVEGDLLSASGAPSIELRTAADEQSGFSAKIEFVKDRPGSPSPQSA
ncbi:MAG: valine--tRNA ligase [Chloroflexi bacterium]|nr:valine--tRNA ligase [Chloroflexota bacterium]